MTGDACPSPTRRLRVNMKILLCHRPGGAFGYITDGWFNALNSCGYEVRRWDGLESSWRQFSPDLYIGCSGHKQPIPSPHGCKVAIHVNPYGPVSIDGINESRENIRWTLAQKPDVVFGYGYDSDRILWSHWENKHGIKWVPMPTAGDAVLYKDVRPAADRLYDLVYLGGRWRYKGQTIDAYLLPALNIKELRYKVHGWGDWPPGICDGILPEDGVVDFLNNGLVGPCISEMHTHQYGIDVPERAFKVALCGALVVHDPVPTLGRVFKSAVIAQNAKNFVDLCRHFTRRENADERQQVVDKQKQEVLEGHTYHHRISKLFEELGFIGDAKRILGWL